MVRTIKLLGEPAIVDGDGQVQAVRGFQAWALLARTLLARAPLDRRSLAAELFPETADPLGALRWSLAALRKALNSSDCLRDDPVECRIPDDVEVDILRLDHDDFDFEAAGPLLGTIEPRCSPQFSTWLLVERERIAGIVEARIRQETIRALAVEAHERAVRLAELGVRRGPYDESAHILLVKSLAMAGRYDAALDHVNATESVFLSEFGEKPSQALRSAARRTISAPPVGISLEAFTNSLIQSGLAALQAGAIDAGIDCLRRAVSEAEKLNDRPVLARAMLELGTALVHAVRGYDDEGSILLRQCTELAGQSGTASIAAAGFRELGYVDALAGRRTAAAAYLARALELVDDRDTLAGIHAVIGLNLVDWGQVAEGLDHYRQALSLARSTGNRRRQIWSLGLGARGLLVADQVDEAQTWLTECLGLVDENRWIAFRPWPVAVLAEVRLRQQHPPADLHSELEEAFALSCQLGDPCWEAAIARAIALKYAAVDDLATAMDWLVEARRRCYRHTDGYAALQVEILASQADISLRQGRHALADTIGREWVSFAARTQTDGHIARAAAFIARDRSASR